MLDHLEEAVRPIDELTERVAASSLRVSERSVFITNVSSLLRKFGRLHKTVGPPTEAAERRLSALYFEESQRYGIDGLTRSRKKSNTG